jgi:hypothetical protein
MALATAGIIATITSAAAATATSIYSAVNQPSSISNTDTAKAEAAAAQAQATALTKRRGMTSTNLTSPMGTTGTSSVGKATLG